MIQKRMISLIAETFNEYKNLQFLRPDCQWRRSVRLVKARRSVSILPYTKEIELGRHGNAESTK